MSKRNAVIFRHTSIEGLGSFHHILRERGYNITIHTTPRTDLSGFDPLAPDLLLVMGGPIGVYQADLYPFLKDEIRIIQARIEQDKPTFGVCLGSQLIAKALGAEVYPGPQGKELGWAPLTLTENARGTEFELLGHEQTNMFHWHGDTFDLPEGAVLMGSSTLYQNQLFTYGENICGVQCHPEVTPDGLKEWWVALVRDVVGDDAPMPLDKVREETELYGETLTNQTRDFFMQWLDKRGL